MWQTASILARASPRFYVLHLVSVAHRPRPHLRPRQRRTARVSPLALRLWPHLRPSRWSCPACFALARARGCRSASRTPPPQIFLLGLNFFFSIETLGYGIAKVRRNKVKGTLVFSLDHKNLFYFLKTAKTRSKQQIRFEIVRIQLQNWKMRGKIIIGLWHRNKNTIVPIITRLTPLHYMKQNWVGPRIYSSMVACCHQHGYCTASCLLRKASLYALSYWKKKLISYIVPGQEVRPQAAGQPNEAHFHFIWWYSDFNNHGKDHLSTKFLHPSNRVGVYKVAIATL
jgi:hypothetical protein